MKLNIPFCGILQQALQQMTDLRKNENEPSDTQILVKLFFLWYTLLAQISKKKKKGERWYQMKKACLLQSPQFSQVPLKVCYGYQPIQRSLKLAFSKPWFPQSLPLKLQCNYLMWVQKYPQQSRSPESKIQVLGRVSYQASSSISYYIGRATL